MKIIQNFLGIHKFKELKDYIFSGQIPLYYNNAVSDRQVDGGKDFMFNHVFYQDDKQTSDLFNKMVMPILGRLTFTHLLRAKLNCYAKKHKFINTPFHTDDNIPHKVALFSFNTCNGYTYFEDTKEKIKSVENQIVLFDGSRRHCSVAQTDTNIRVNININII